MFHRFLIHDLCRLALMSADSKEKNTPSFLCIQFLVSKESSSNSTGLQDYFWDPG